MATGEATALERPGRPLAQMGLGQFVKLVGKPIDNCIAETLYYLHRQIGNGEMRKQLNIRIPQTHLDRLVDLATDEELSQSEMVMRLIDQAWERKMSTTEQSDKKWAEVQALNVQLKTLADELCEARGDWHNRPFRLWPADVVERTSEIEQRIERLTWQRDDAMEAFAQLQPSPDLYRFEHIRDREMYARKYGDL